MGLIAVNLVISVTVNRVSAFYQCVHSCPAVCQDDPVVVYSIALGYVLNPT